jgi:hypothetical protein
MMGLQLMLQVDQNGRAVLHTYQRCQMRAFFSHCFMMAEGGVYRIDMHRRCKCLQYRVVDISKITLF